MTWVICLEKNTKSCPSCLYFCVLYRLLSSISFPSGWACWHHCRRSQTKHLHNNENRITLRFRWLQMYQTCSKIPIDCPFWAGTIQWFVFFTLFLQAFVSYLILKRFTSKVDSCHDFFVLSTKLLYGRTCSSPPFPVKEALFLHGFSVWMCTYLRALLELPLLLLPYQTTSATPRYYKVAQLILPWTLHEFNHLDTDCPPSLWPTKA